MNVEVLTADRRDEWTSFAQQEQSCALLQSWEWGEFKERSGWKAFRLATRDEGGIVAGAQLLVRTLPGRISGVAYVPRGPLGDWLRPDVTAPLLDALHDIARRHRAAFLRIEPRDPVGSPATPVLEELGFSQSPSANQPRATLVVDLTPEPDALLARLGTRTRYNIRLSARRGVQVREGDASDIEVAHRLLHATARRNRFRERSAAYHLEQWNALASRGLLRLLLAEYDGEPLAVNISAAFGRCGAYLHGASSGAHRELKPNDRLVWEAMLWARSRGCAAFDLWGIPDEVGLAAAQGLELPDSESTEGLWGVYRFKRGFGGDIVCHTAAHDFAYSRRLYSLAHRVVVRAGASDRRGAPQPTRA